MRVLVVDGDFDSAASLTRSLKVGGCDAQSAQNGQAALNVIRDWEPDVVPFDLGDSDMKRYEIAGSVLALQLYKRPLLIGVSGHRSEQDNRCSREGDIDLHLIRPVDPKRLLRLLQRFESIVCQ